MHKFSDFADEADAKPLDGDKMKLADVIDKKICVLAAKIRASKHKRDGCDEYATIQFTYEGDDKRHILFTGSSVMIAALKKYGDQTPFETVIRKIDKYFTFS